MAGTHALLAPSAAERWMTCPGSVQYTRDDPNTSSEYAAEGTVYHGIASEALERPLECAAWIGDVREADGFKFIIDAENAAFAQVYVDRMRARPGVHFVEINVKLDSFLGVPDQSGTSDHVAIDAPNKTIYVDDLKFGKGEMVYAPKNKQGMLYALGTLAKYAKQFGIGPEWKVIIGIHQPRVNHFDEWATTVMELIEWARDEAAPAAKFAYELWAGNAPEHIVKLSMKESTKGCRWCPAGGRCPVRANKIIAMFPLASPEVIAQKRNGMDDAELGAMWAKLPALENWITALRAEALARALAGATIPGAKLAEGRKGARAFTDLMIAEAALFSVIGDKAYKPRTLITPTEAERHLKAKHPEAWTTLTEHWITQAPGALSLVPLEDDRPPMKITTPEFPHVSPATEGLL